MSWMDHEPPVELRWFLYAMLAIWGSIVGVGYLHGYNPR